MRLPTRPATISRRCAAPPMGGNCRNATLALFVEGMTRVYARARRLADKGLESADPAVLHEARKSVIHLRYQLDMLEPIWPALVGAWVKELQRLREVLGDFNDLCELEVADQ